MGSLLWFSLSLLAFLEIAPIALAANDVHKSLKPGLLKKVKDKKDYNRYQDWGIDWSDESMLQHPIDEAPRRINRQLGEICTYSKDCGSTCCLLERESKVRSCQPKATLGERCSNAQVKGDLYVDACPCAAGNDYCTHGALCVK